MIRAAVVGAGGYAGIEVVRTLLGHPSFELVAATSGSLAHQRIADVYPALEGMTDLEFVLTDHSELVQSCDVVFLAVPHTAAMSCAPLYHSAGVAVIDLSADFRIHDQAVFEMWYGCAHTAPELLPIAIYGQPESHRINLAVRGSDWRESGDPDLAPVVACAGCYPTATILACLPALVAGIVESSPIVVSAMSGVSGAGRGANQRTHFCSADASVQAYSAGSHRHTPEIEQELSELAGRRAEVVFTPHLVPMKRGLLSTVTMRFAAGMGIDDAMAAYSGRYEMERFVHFLGERMPQTSSVMGGNHAHVGIACDPRAGMLIASCAIDNLGKGAATQAVQCANIVFGLDESAGSGFAHPVV